MNNLSVKHLVVILVVEVALTVGAFYVVAVDNVTDRMKACAKACASKQNVELFISEPYPAGSSTYRTICKCRGESVSSLFGLPEANSGNQ